MADASFNYLIEILRDHDIPYDREALKAAFNDPKSQTAVLDWVAEYLSPETILTKEEAALYALSFLPYNMQLIPLDMPR